MQSGAFSCVLCDDELHRLARGYEAQLLRRGGHQRGPQRVLRGSSEGSSEGPQRVLRGVLRGSSEGPQRVLRGSSEGSSEGSQLASTCGEGTVEQSHVSLSCTASTRKPIVLVEVDCSRNCR